MKGRKRSYTEVPCRNSASSFSLRNYTCLQPEYSLEEMMLKLQYFDHLDVKSQLIGKDPDAEKNWGQEEKGVAEDEMVGCHQWLNGYEFEQTQGDSEGQGSLACCSLWGHEELDMTEWQENNFQSFDSRLQF